MPRKIARPAETDDLDFETLQRDIIQFEGLREQIEMLTERQEEIKKRLKSLVEQHGEEDAKGNLIVDLNGEIAGVEALQLQRRVKQTFDEAKAESLLTDLGILEVCQTTMTYIDQDKVMAASYDGLLSQDDVLGLITEKVSFAYTPKRVK